MSLRIGHGYDIHRTVAGRPLVLGGVLFESDFGLDGSQRRRLRHPCDLRRLPRRGRAARHRQFLSRHRPDVAWRRLAGPSPARDAGAPGDGWEPGQPRRDRDRGKAADLEADRRHEGRAALGSTGPPLVLDRHSRRRPTKASMTSAAGSPSRPTRSRLSKRHEAGAASARAALAACAAARRLLPRDKRQRPATAPRSCTAGSARTCPTSTPAGDADVRTTPSCPRCSRGSSEDPVDLHPVPGVAERWERLARRAHLHLPPAPGARWSNGDPVTSGDFIASWRRMLTPVPRRDEREPALPHPGRGGVLPGRLRFLQVGLRAPDPRTLTVLLEHPAPWFLSLLSSPAWMPVPLRPWPNTARCTRGATPGPDARAAGSATAPSTSSRGAAARRSWSPGRRPTGMRPA
jgi:hypothetical protein